MEFFAFFFPPPLSSGRTSCLLQSKGRWTECASRPARPLGEVNRKLQLRFRFRGSITVYSLVGFMLQIVFKDYLTKEV